MRFTQSVILVRILARASQSAFYTDESVRTGLESGPLVRSGPRFIAYLKESLTHASCCSPTYACSEDQPN